jgi:hypothetical protein
MIARRDVGRSRRGSFLAETAMSAVMLMIAMGLVAKVVGWTAAERRNQERRLCAALEGANLMERLSARPFETLTTDAVKNTSLSPEAVRTLPDAQLKIDVAERHPTGGDDAKRIALELRWRSRSGEFDAPLRLTTWVYRRKGGVR